MSIGFPRPQRWPAGHTRYLARGALAGLAALALAGIALVPGAVAAPHAAAASCPWVGSTAPISQRVSELLAQMTVPDEIALVHGTSGSYVGNVAANPALCIPALDLQDGPAGVGDGMTGVTQLPAPVAATSTWDTSLEQQYGQVIGAEDAGKGVNVDLGPTINMVRDPRWGRAFETMGEDPYLAGQMSAADIEGVQSQDVMAMVKHYAVYNQETNRNSPADNAIVDPRVEQEIYLPAFNTAVNQGGAAAVMCAYSTINGDPACDDPYTLNTVLKGQFGFNGFVTSDWGATKDGVQSAADGLDMQMPDDSTFGAPLETAVDNGTVPKSVLDGMATRILTEMFRFGIFDNPATGSPTATVTTPAHVATAQQVATEGTVLLKNAGNALPLDPAKAQSIAIIGDDATGDATTDGGGSAGVSASSLSTPLQAISDRIAPASGLKVTASAYTATNSTGLETTSDTGGGQDVGWINNTSWLEYSNVNFGSGGSPTVVQTRLASQAAVAGDTIQFRLDSLTATPFATVQVPSTGGWQTWTTSLPAAASPEPTGVHTLYVTFASPQSGNFVNVNWFSFGAASASAQYSEGADDVGQLPDITAGEVTPSQGSGPGLYAQYYNNMTLSGTPVVTQVDQNYNVNYNGTAPVAGVNADQWSAKWTGTFTPSVTGTYYFSTTGDDGSRLFVNGQELVNNWRDGYAITSDGSISLTAGQAVPIEIDYYQDGGGSELFVGAQAPDSTSPIAAAAQLAAKSNVAIVFASLPEAEGTDLTSIDLPGLQNPLIEAVAAANPNTIVVLNTGSAVTMPWLSQVAGRHGGLVSRPAGRRVHRLAAVRRRRSVRQAAGHLPQEPGRRAGQHPGAMARHQQRGAVLRGPGHRLPVVRREQHHPAVPVRLWPVLHILLLQQPGAQLVVGLAVEPGDRHRRRHQHRIAQRRRGGPAVPHGPGRRGRAAAAAQGLPAGQLDARPDPAGELHGPGQRLPDLGRFVVVLDHRQRRLHDLGWRLLGQPAAVGHLHDQRRVRLVGSGDRDRLAVRGEQQRRPGNHQRHRRRPGRRLDQQRQLAGVHRSQLRPRGHVGHGPDRLAADPVLDRRRDPVPAGLADRDAVRDRPGDRHRRLAELGHHGRGASVAGAERHAHALCHVQQRPECQLRERQRLHLQRRLTAMRSMISVTAALLAAAALCLSAPAASAMPAAGAGCGTTNAALGQPATASSLESGQFPASAAVDGNTSTRWSSAWSDPQWLQVDLGSAQSICQVVLDWENPAYATAYQIQVSADAINWTTIYSTTTGAGGTETLNVTGSGRYIRMYGTARASGYGYSLYEFQVFTGVGSGTGAPPPTWAPVWSDDFAGSAGLGSVGGELDRGHRDHLGDRRGQLGHGGGRDDDQLDQQRLPGWPGPPGHHGPGFRGRLDVRADRDTARRLRGTGRRRTR